MNLKTPCTRKLLRECEYNYLQPGSVFRLRMLEHQVTRKATPPAPMSPADNWLTLVTDFAGSLRSDATSRLGYKAGTSAGVARPKSPFFQTVANSQCQPGRRRGEKKDGTVALRQSCRRRRLVVVVRKAGVGCERWRSRVVLVTLCAVSTMPGAMSWARLLLCLPASRRLRPGAQSKEAAIDPIWRMRTAKGQFCQDGSIDFCSMATVHNQTRRVRWSGV